MRSSGCESGFIIFLRATTELSSTGDDGEVGSGARLAVGSVVGVTMVGALDPGTGVVASETKPLIASDMNALLSVGLGIVASGVGETTVVGAGCGTSGVLGAGVASGALVVSGAF